MTYRSGGVPYRGRRPAQARAWCWRALAAQGLGSHLQQAWNLGWCSHSHQFSLDPPFPPSLFNIFDPWPYPPTSDVPAPPPLVQDIGSHLLRDGLNLTKISMPVKLFEPRSWLERMCDNWCAEGGGGRVVAGGAGGGVSVFRGWG